MSKNNILISGDGQAVLSDFGLSKIIEDLAGPSDYTSDSCAGPLRWLAPEFMQDESRCPQLASDVWSFACTAYEVTHDRSLRLQF